VLAHQTVQKLEALGLSTMAAALEVALVAVAPPWPCRHPWWLGKQARFSREHC